MVIWIIGISGSGKTTLGQELSKRFKSNGRSVVFLDGDIFRSFFHKNIRVEPYDEQYRRKVGNQLTDLCMLLDDQNIDVICCTISPFNDLRANHRKDFSNYIEIHMDCRVSDAHRRDNKQLYSKFSRGKIKNVVGCDLRYERPTEPDLRISSHKDEFSLDEIANRTYKFIQDRM